MFDKDKNRRFKIDKNSEKEENSKVRFKKLTRQRPTKNLWVLLALLIVAIIIYFYLRGVM